MGIIFSIMKFIIPFINAKKWHIVQGINLIEVSPPHAPLFSHYLGGFAGSSTSITSKFFPQGTSPEY